MNTIDILLIIGNDGEYIPITSIDTINVRNKLSTSDTTASLLRGDFTITVTLQSGKQHTCAMGDTIAGLESDGISIGALTAEEFYFRHVHSAWTACLKSRRIK